MQDCLFDTIASARKLAETQKWVHGVVLEFVVVGTFAVDKC